MRGRSGSYGGRGTDTNGPSQPTTILDLYEKMVDPTVEDPFLGDNNLGLGNYSDEEFYHQLASFRDGLYAEAAFARLLFDRAVYETKCALAREEWESMSEEERAKKDSETLNEYLLEAGDRCFNELGDWNDDDAPNPPEAKAAAIEDYAGLSGEWIPPHWRMLLARHETSRSRNAKLLDSVTAPKRQRGDGDRRRRMEPTETH